MFFCVLLIFTKWYRAIMEKEARVRPSDDLICFKYVNKSTELFFKSSFIGLWTSIKSQTLCISSRGTNANEPNKLSQPLIILFSLYQVHKPCSWIFLQIAWEVASLYSWIWKDLLESIIAPSSKSLKIISGFILNPD